jgi:hypothetical protein
MVNHGPSGLKRDGIIQGMVYVGNRNEAGLPHCAVLEMKKVPVYQTGRFKKRGRKILIGGQSKKRTYRAKFDH